MAPRTPSSWRILLWGAAALLLALLIVRASQPAGQPDAPAAQVSRTPPPDAPAAPSDAPGRAKTTTDTTASPDGGPFQPPTPPQDGTFDAPKDLDDAPVRSEGPEQEAQAAERARQRLDRNIDQLAEALKRAQAEGKEEQAALLRQRLKHLRARRAGLAGAPEGSR